MAEQSPFKDLDLSSFWKSRLMYDLQFLLQSHGRVYKSQEAYLQAYPEVIAMMGDSHFGTGGWAPSFVEDWFTARVKAGQIVQADGGWRFSEDYRTELLQQLQAYHR